MNEGTLELYLSNDILQGEDVPFYILWDDENIKEICLNFEGFTCINEYHNVVNDFSTSCLRIKKEDLKVDGYLGGTLKTPLTNKPFLESFLKVTLMLSNENCCTLREERILYSTILEIKQLPKTIFVPFETSPFEIQLKGLTTAFINLKTNDSSDLHFDLPSETKQAVEIFSKMMNEGLEELKGIYPNNLDFINSLMVDIQKQDHSSKNQIVNKLGHEIDELDLEKEFKEALVNLVINSFQKNDTIKEALIKPFIEYLDASAEEKVFLESPFLCLNVPKGKHTLKCTISHKNILEKQSDIDNYEANSIYFETVLESREDVQVSMKDFVKIRRINNGTNS